MKVWPLILLGMTSCILSPPELYEVGGRSEIHRDHKFMGITYDTDVERIETPKQVKERLVTEKAEREQEIELKRKELQESAAFWFGAACLALAGGCVLAGYVMHGYKFWGGLAFVFTGLGACIWGFAHWLPYLKWAILPVVGVGAAWTLHKSKDFSVAKSLAGITRRISSGPEQP